MNEPKFTNASAETASLPMLSLDRFMQETGLSPTTVWRYRNRGWLECVNIAGRLYVTREEIARFNARAGAGEFAKTVKTPRRKVG